MSKFNFSNNNNVVIIYTKDNICFDRIWVQSLYRRKKSSSLKCNKKSFDLKNGYSFISKKLG